LKANQNAKKWRSCTIVSPVLLSKLFSFCLAGLCFCFIGTKAVAQTPQLKSIDFVRYVQLTGLTVSKDSLSAVPFATIYAFHTKTGTNSDWRGYFSLVVEEGDTVQFSGIGYHTVRFVVPKNVENNRYSVVQMMLQDTITLHTVKIYPWPSRNQFKQAFVSAKVADKNGDIARKNLSPDVLASVNARMTMNGSENYKAYMQQFYDKQYYLGQTNYTTLGSGTVPVPSSLLNPINWYKFIQSLKKKQ